MKTEGIKPHELRAAMLELLTFLGSSARGTIDEPKLYGPLRLIEAAQRVINVMEYLGVSDKELNAIADRFVVEAMEISLSETYCARFAEEAIEQFTEKLRDA